MKITNNSKALQGVNTLSGVVYLQPGESRDDLDFSVEEGLHVKTLKFLRISGGEPANEPANPDALDRDDLKKQAAELGLDHPRNIPTEKLKDLVDAKLAE